MSSTINRRNWIKAAALLSGGLGLSTGKWNAAFAAPPPTGTRFISDAEFGKFVPPQLKARLFANENPFGPSDKAKNAIIESLSTSYQYPFMDAETLVEKIATSEGLTIEHIMPGAGSSPLLAAAALYFSKDGGSIISGAPSYEDLPEHAQALKAKWVKVPLTKEYQLDLEAMEKAVDSTTRLVYICNPNNPTGTVVNTEQLKSFCERVSKKVTVFVDEAYIDYLPDPKAASLIDGVKNGQNIIVARTFSKLYGFAGLRVGYILAQPAMIKQLEPYSTGVICMAAPALKAALASYQDHEFLAGALKKTVESREFLYKVLKQEGYEYIPSSTNFVMFPIKMDGQKFTMEMMKRGVGLRNWKFNDKHWCRISIGRMDEMLAFEAAFKEIS